MSRAPQLTKNVISSIHNLLDTMAPADYLGTDKEAGVVYLTALLRHVEDPGTKAKRQSAANKANSWRAAK